jgi:hypothetical protein
MLWSANQKVVASMDTATTASSGTATLTIDRLDYDHASIAVVRASNSATGFATVLKVQESDDNSTFSDVTAFVGGGTGGFTIPTVSNTNAAAIVKFDIDCRAKKRYLKVLYTPTTAVNCFIEARLGRPHASPASAADAGCIGLVSG